MSSLVVIDEDEFFQKLRIAIREEINSSLPQESIPEAGPIEFAVKITGFKKNTIYSLVSKREIPFYKKGRKVYFKKDELYQWMLKEKKSTMDQKFEQYAQNVFKRL